MIPDKKNRDAWWAFLEGAPESVWNPPRSMKHGNEHRGQRDGGPFTLCSKLILPPNDPSATHQPPFVAPLDDDTTQKPRELSPTQLFRLDHVCSPPFPRPNSPVRCYLALLSSACHVLYVLVQPVSSIPRCQQQRRRQYYLGIRADGYPHAMDLRAPHPH